MKLPTQDRPEAQPYIEPRLCSSAQVVVQRPQLLRNQSP